MTTQPFTLLLQSPRRLHPAILPLALSLLGGHQRGLPPILQTPSRPDQPVIGTARSGTGTSPTDVDRVGRLQAVPVDTGAGVASPPVLTPEVVAHFAAFLTRYHHEPPTIGQAAQATRVLIDLPIGPIPGGPRIQSAQPLPFLDLGRLAATVPAVAADFQQAGLAPAQYLPILEAIASANYTDGIDETMHNGTPSAFDTTTVAGKNVIFERAHLSELNALKINWPSIKVKQFPQVADQGEQLVGHPAPQLEVGTWLNGVAGGRQTTFGDGHVYVVEFTAHWCGPCRQVYPILTTLLSQYAGHGVRVLYATQLFGWYGDPDHRVAPAMELDSLTQYIQEHHLTAPIAIIPNVDLSGYTVANFPKLVVIDQAGIVRFVQSGWSDGLATKLSAAVARLVSQQATP